MAATDPATGCGAEKHVFRKAMKLHFHETGAGKPLILLHGLLGSHRNWLPVAGRFAARRRVLAVDQRNHGCSPHDDVCDYDAMAGDLNELMRDQHLVRADVLGQSMGGKTAMRLAQLHPDRVDRLIVVDMSPGARPPAFAGILDAMLALDLRRFSRREQIADALAPVVTDAALRGFLLTNVERDETGGFRWRPDLRAIRRNYLLLTAALPATSRFNGPALFVRGGNSDYLRAGDLARIRELFPRATMAAIPNAGHWVHADAPEEFARVVEDFLD
jgi:pimeloyl-ACP methyl ester carboxylesterase